MALCCFQIVVFHTEEPLRDDYTLMDIAYIYTWRRVSAVDIGQHFTYIYIFIYHVMIVINFYLHSTVKI